MRMFTRKQALLCLVVGLLALTSIEAAGSLANRHGRLSALSRSLKPAAAPAARTTVATHTKLAAAHTAQAAVHTTKAQAAQAKADAAQKKADAARATASAHRQQAQVHVTAAATGKAPKKQKPGWCKPDWDERCAGSAVACLFETADCNSLYGPEGRTMQGPKESTRDLDTAYQASKAAHPAVRPAAAPSSTPAAPTHGSMVKWVDPRDGTTHQLYNPWNAPTAEDLALGPAALAARNKIEDAKYFAAHPNAARAPEPRQKK